MAEAVSHLTLQRNQDRRVRGGHPWIFSNEVASVEPEPADGGLVDVHDVRLIVPLTDLDHAVLAREREALAPALVLLPSAEVCGRMGDKYLAHLFFEEHGIPSPPSWLPGDVPGDVRFPLLVKVREGFGSRHIHRVRDADELVFFLRYTPVESFVQQQCLGEEFSIDVFCDLESRCLNAIPRTMIQSKGGESIKGMTIKDWELIEHGRRVAETIGIVGPANIQCFREPDGSLPVTDVNPRFGGAFPPRAAGMLSGARAPLARGERPEPRWRLRKVVMTRFSPTSAWPPDGWYPLSKSCREDRRGVARASRPLALPCGG